MTVISYTSNFWDDIARLTNFLLTQDTELALNTYDIVMDGIGLLSKHPEIGRLSLKNDLRELVISRGKTGYIALYSYDSSLDLITVISIWHQREAGLS